MQLCVFYLRLIGNVWWYYRFAFIDNYRSTTSLMCVGINYHFFWHFCNGDHVWNFLFASLCYTKLPKRNLFLEQRIYSYRFSSLRRATFGIITWLIWALLKYSGYCSCLPKWLCRMCPYFHVYFRNTLEKSAFYPVQLI